MKTILLTFDVEEFDFSNLQEEQQFEVSKTGLLSLLSLLESHDLTSTFFTTAVFANNYPELIRAMSKKHEIACHGYSHADSYADMKNLLNIPLAKKELEQITGKEIHGFRAPRWNIKNITAVEQAGFFYDSSSHPIYLPGKYFNLSQKKKIHKRGNLYEIPLSTLPPNFSIFWLAFKNFPLTYSKLFTKVNFLKSNYTMLVFHPWEFADLSKINLPRYIKRKHSQEFLNMLSNYIDFCKAYAYNFSTVFDFLKLQQSL